MSTDIIFNATFPSPVSAALRFAALWELLATRSRFEGPGAVRVYELVNSAHPVAVLDGAALDEDSAARVKSLLAEYEAEKYSVAGTWLVGGTRDGVGYRVEVTTRSPRVRDVPPFERGVDVTWNIGAVDRPLEGSDDSPNAERVISDLRVLLELGASSVWSETGTAPFEL